LCFQKLRLRKGVVYEKIVLLNVIYFFGVLLVGCGTITGATSSNSTVSKNNWILDVVFKEDKNTVRKDFAPQNLAVLRRIVLNILKKDSSIKKSCYCF
jgi:hypothetical protein